MKKISSALLIFLFLFSSSLYADDAWIKLGRGLSNIGWGWVEIFRQPSLMAKTQRWPVALGGGIPKGIVYAVYRTGVGVYETVTFPFPIPAGYKRIISPDVPFSAE